MPKITILPDNKVLDANNGDLLLDISLTNDIARSMSSQSARISNVSGKNAVGIKDLCRNSVQWFAPTQAFIWRT